MWSQVATVACWVMLAGWLAQLVLVGIPLLAFVLILRFREVCQARRDHALIRAAP
jgi:hypothetical protein